ncbi:hypothetical protein [Fimbriiglobus ruber]|uniref:hypothetical protein n=1 Tax=Fimbriiglobus ruber TaxID=1908690 RepID=UPI000B4A6F0E|nr:hypothetical protein [Fimbriiglobus ruber]
MKVPQSVRMLYGDLEPQFSKLKVEVDRIIIGKKQLRWHYESRVKEEISFALKLETGRVRKPVDPEDLFACTLVVENRSKIAEAEALIMTLFKLEQRRPKDQTFTHIAPHSFDFDDLRLYVRWTDAGGKPSGLDGLQFEVQVKTFLQHAWGIATHDFVYKSDDVDWSGSRIAYQVKAMLENAELSIAEAQTLATSAMLNRIDGECKGLRIMIGEIKKRWEPARLPKDLRRLAQTLGELLQALDMSFNDMWAFVDEATAAGEGAKTLNLSPYSAVVAALLRKRGAATLFGPLGKPWNKRSLFVPLEIDLPALPDAVQRKLIRPKDVTGPAPGVVVTPSAPPVIGA